jgi:hypothetical protein
MAGYGRRGGESGACLPQRDGDRRRPEIPQARHGGTADNQQAPVIRPLITVLPRSHPYQRFRAALFALARRSRATRRARSAGARTLPGSTSISSRRRSACRAEAVAEDRSATRAHRSAEAMPARSARGDLFSPRVITVLVTFPEQHSIDVLAAAGAEQLDPGWRAHRSAGLSRARLGDQARKRLALATPAHGRHQSLEPTGGEIGGHDSERPSFEGGAAASSGVATQPGEAALGRDDEQENELRASREYLRPGVELGADLRRVLAGFVDFETHDGGAIGPLENDDAVRPSRQKTRIAGRSLRKP